MKEEAKSVEQEQHSPLSPEEQQQEHSRPPGRATTCHSFIQNTNTEYKYKMQIQIANTKYKIQIQIQNSRPPGRGGGAFYMGATTCLSFIQNTNTNFKYKIQIQNANTKYKYKIQIQIQNSRPPGRGGGASYMGATTCHSFPVAQLSS